MYCDKTYKMYENYLIMVIQVLNSKLGIYYVFRSHLQPSSWTREPYTKIHKHGLNHSIMTYR